MRFDAVIFDLFGTLIYNRPWGDAMNRAVAAALGAPVEGFVEEWARTGPRRTAGGYASMAGNVEEVCRTLGVAITAEQAERAAAIRLDYTRRNFRLKDGALELLSRLREMELTIGLLSNCTPEIPVVWRESPLAPLFHATVFSCDVGMVKPEPAIFEMACRAVATPPERCVYVADNADGELDAAQALGMRAVMLRPSEGEAPPRDSERWRGAAIASLLDLLELFRET